MTGFKAPLHVLPDPVAASEYRRDAASITEGVRPHLVSLAKTLEKAHEPLAAHKARSVLLPLQLKLPGPTGAVVLPETDAAVPSNPEGSHRGGGTSAPSPELSGGQRLIYAELGSEPEALKVIAARAGIFPFAAVRHMQALVEKDLAIRTELGWIRR